MGDIRGQVFYVVVTNGNNASICAIRRNCGRRYSRRRRDKRWSCERYDVVESELIMNNAGDG